MEEPPMSKCPNSLEKNEAVEYQEIKVTKNPSINIVRSNNGPLLIKDNAHSNVLDEGSSSHALQNNHISSVEQHTSHSYMFQKIATEGHDRYGLNVISPLLTEKDRMRLIRQSGNCIAFDELNYNRQKFMEKNNFQITNSEVNKPHSFIWPPDKNQELIFTEDNNCFRITKPNSFISRNKCKGDNKIVRDYKESFEKSDYYDLKYDADGKNNWPLEKRNKITSFKTDNHSVSQSNWGNHFGFQKLNDTNGISQYQTANQYSALRNRFGINRYCYPTNDRDQSTRFYLQIDRESKIQNKNRIPRFTLRNDEKANHKNMNGDKSKSSGELEEAFLKYTTGINKVLQQKLKEQENEQILDYQERHRPLETMNGRSELYKLQNRTVVKKSFEINQLGLNELQYKREKQTESSGSHTSINISQTNNRNQLLEINQHSTNKSQIKDIYRNEPFRFNKENYYMRSNSNDKRFGNRVCGQTDKDFYAGINHENWAVAKEGNTNEVSHALKMHHSLLHPQYLHPQMYWPASYFVYKNPSIDILNYQNYWWSIIQPNYQRPVESFKESNTFNHVPLPLPQPYTGVAGYNWPTIRKPLKSAEHEEKNDYPVYVKPPLIGSEETEQLRNAYIRYVKWLRYRLYKMCARKQKQMERRERNHKSRIASRLYKADESDTHGPEIGGGKFSSQILHLCQGSSDKLQRNVPDSTEQIENKLKQLSEAKSCPPPSNVISVSTDISNTDLQSGFPFETLRQKLTENYRKDSVTENSTKMPLKDLVNLESDSFEIAEHDFVRETSSRSANQPIDYFSTEEREQQSLNHPIYGPVCRWKEAFLDEYVTSNEPDELDK